MPARRVVGVAEVAVYPDRVELLAAGRWVAFRFWDLAEWPRPVWAWKGLARLGWWARWLPVGGRGGAREPGGPFFRFATSPAVTVHMPADDPPGEAGRSSRRVEAVIRGGRFGTWDLDWPPGYE